MFHGAGVSVYFPPSSVVQVMDSPLILLAGGVVVVADDFVEHSRERSVHLLGSGGIGGKQRPPLRALGERNRNLERLLGITRNRITHASGNMNVREQRPERPDGFLDDSVIEVAGFLFHENRRVKFETLLF